MLLITACVLLQDAGGPQERERAEAAAQLERRMAAMEAVLAARRSTATEEPHSEMSQIPGGDARFAVCTHSLATVPKPCKMDFCCCDGGRHRSRGS